MAAKKAGFGMFRVDAPDFKKVARAFEAVGEETKLRIIPKSLNFVGKQANTQIKRKLAKETGMAYGRVGRRVQLWRATPGRPVFTIHVRDRHGKITMGNYGARQQKAGVRHKAWGGKLAKGAFILRSGSGGPAVARTGPGRRAKLKNLYGPNIAREVERNQHFILAKTNELLGTKYVPEVLRLIDMALQKQKSRQGL